LKSCDLQFGEIPISFSINWLIGTRHLFAFANDRRESPHKLPVSIFKERPRNQPGEPRIMRHSARLSTPARDFIRSSECPVVLRDGPGHSGRARSIARHDGASTPEEKRCCSAKT